MKKSLSIILAAALLFSMTTLFANAEEAEVALGALASVTATVGNFHTIDAGDSIFANRTYAFGQNIPSYLAGKPYLRTNIADSVSATVKTDGWVYVITQVHGASDSQEASLTADGFTKIAAIPAATLWSTHKYESAVMAKEVRAGDTVSFGKWGILVANEGEEKFTLGSLATVMPTFELPGVIAVGEQIFVDRTTHLFAETLPDYLLGQNYISGSLDEGSSVSVTKDGWIYVITPVSGKSNSQVSALTDDGFATVAVVNAKAISATISESLVVMGKEVRIGDRVTVGKWGIIVADSDESYEASNLSRTAPTVISNPTSGEYIDGNRRWQGIPSITKDNKSGRLWATWYAGGSGEGAYNFVLLYTSDDDGKTWTGPVIAIDHEYPVRCFDPNLWVDPDGRMWMFWSQSRFHKDGVFGTWMMYTDNPESADPTWSTPVRVANGIAMNDPIVLSNGDWLLPTAIWAYESAVEEIAKEINSNVYISKDKGMTWEYLGSVQSYEGSRDCDENMMVEQTDGSLRMLIRTGLGIEESYSYDGGATWTGAVDADISNVVSRFYITRLSSGNQLLVYNDPPRGGTSRSHMTAAISTDDGKTWSHKIVMDERSGTSYPDAVEDADGNIYIIYDCGRKTHGKIMMAKITEADILAGKIVTEGSALKVHINNNTSLDQNGDGVCNVADVLTVLASVVNKIDIEADINGDDTVNLLDVLLLLKRIAK